MKTSVSIKSRATTRRQAAYRLPSFAMLLVACLGAVAARADTAPAITTVPASQTVNQGQAVTFSVVATGTPLNYQWYHDGAAIAGATSASYAIAAATAADAGGYTVVVSNAAGTVKPFVEHSAQYAAGAMHSLFVKKDGTLWATGYNSYGQLGDGGFYYNRYAPVQVASGVIAVDAGSYHSVFLKSDGTLWAMGANGSGQLGDGTWNNRSTPVQVATGVSAVEAGNNHTVFLKTDGTLWAMGTNYYGQLGDGTSSARNVPVQIASGVASVSAGGDTTFFVKTDGTLWGTGANGYGQLGDNTQTNHFSPFQVATGVASVAAGSGHTLFLKTDGTLWGMGSDSYGQLADATFAAHYLPVQLASNVARMAAGGSCTVYVKTDGTLWGMGANFTGQLGSTLPSTFSATPTQIAANVLDVRSGDSHTLFRRADGMVWAMGANWYGQLGDGTTSNRTSPVPVVCTGDSYAVLNVIIPPSITTPPASQAVVAGSNISLQATVAGTAPFTYQWQKDGVNLPSGTGSTYSIGPFSVANVGNYTVTVTNPAGSVTSAAAKLDISLPILSAQPTVNGKKVSLQATTGGSGSIQWQVSTDGGATWTAVTEGDTYTGSQSTTLYILKATTAMNDYRYRYTVTGNGQTVTSPPLALNVFTSPLNMPSGIVRDNAGNLFVTDAASQTLLKIAPDLKLSVVAGKQNTMGSADGTGTAAQFNEPTGLMLFLDGSMVVSDTSNSTIRAVSSAGAVTTLAGMAGQTGSTDGDGPAARFNAPAGLTADLAGVYVVADQANHVIRQVTAAGRTATLAGKAGIPGVADGTGSDARFNSPAGLAIRRDQYSYTSWSGGNNGYGTIFVSDQLSNTIRTILATGGVSTYCGTAGQAGISDGWRTNARFNKPSGLAMDLGGNLYVADMGNHTIRKVDTGGFVTTVAGFPGVSGLMDGLKGNALFSSPEGLAVASDGSIYVADTGNSAIRKIDTSGYVSTLLILGNVPVIGTQPANQTVNTGSSVTFSVAATGEGTLTYQWKKGDVNIAGATSSTYTISSASASDAGNYTVLVSNAWGSVTSSAASLTVNTPPPPPPPSSGGGGGGGGAPSPLFLAALGAAALLRRVLRSGV